MPTNKIGLGLRILDTKLTHAGHGMGICALDLYRRNLLSLSQNIVNLFRTRIPIKDLTDDSVLAVIDLNQDEVIKATAAQRCYNF